MHKVISFWVKSLKNRSREARQGLPAHKKSIIPHREIMRKKHSKTKSLEFQRSRDGVVLTIWTGLFILPGRPSKSQGIFYLFGSNGKKIGKNDHYMHR